MGKKCLGTFITLIFLLGFASWGGCLTYKPEFFGTLGFAQVEKMTLPHKVWNECYRCPKFPDCDEVAMVCRLETEA